MLEQEILSKEIDLSLFDKYHFSGRLVKDFILKCLNKNSSSRASAEELLNDPWIMTHK